MFFGEGEIKRKIALFLQQYEYFCKVPYKKIIKPAVNDVRVSNSVADATHLDTREKASAHTAGHGTILIITCSSAAWKCARVTFSSTEASVATSPTFVLGSPPTVSKMFPPCTASSSTWVLHFLCKRRMMNRERCYKSKKSKKKKKRVEHTHLCILQTFNASLRGAAWTAQLVQTLWIR